ncbi:MAG: tetratricopeptide repeat protein [Cyanobacteria bacterium SZAS-4]|nr:tetratricopeptide repeat protein [Cyanobacteria bacterium SZAS-4]
MKNRIVLALSFSMLAGFYAASEARADDPIDARIEKAEQMLLGKTAVDQPVESRLDAVEMNLYGKTKHGSVQKRVDSISDFLGLKDGGASKSSKPAMIDAAKGDEPRARDDLSKGDATKVDSEKGDSVTAKEESERASSQAASQCALQAERENTDFEKADASKSDVSKSGESKTAAVKVDASKLSKSGPSKPLVSKTDAIKASAEKKSSVTGKVGLIPLKPLEAKMAIPPTAPKKVESMPPAAPSIAATMNSTNLNSQARNLLREGLRQYSNGQYREAEDTFRRVLTVDPRNADAFYNLGSLAERNHDYVIALTNYRAALNFNPKDKDYIAAVTAMEHQLSASARSSAASTSAKRTATLGHFQVPVDAATSSAPLTASSPVGAYTGQPFQLSGTQNDVLMNTTQFTNSNYMPTMNVNQQPPPPTMGVAQQAPKKGGGLGKVMNVGMRAALYSSGLHCPICRMMGGGFHF